MKSLCIHSLVIIILQTHVKSQGPCGERNVTGAVGGAVTLRVTYTGDGSITWNFGDKGDNIAIALPVGQLQIQRSQYEGRLSSSSDGSLTITNLQHEDKGTYRAQSRNLDCSYHLSVFRNLTAADITFSSNVTDNTTCEMILTCSVNATKKSNVTVTWRSLNSSDISPLTENVVLVPPSHNHLTYLCTANNPVSSVSKAVLPREYCERNNTSGETINQRTRIAIIVAVVFTIIIIIIIIIIVFWIARGKRSESVSENKEQKPGKERNKQNDVKGKQGPSVSVVTTVYDEVYPPQEVDAERIYAKEQKKNKYFLFQATDSKESPSDVDTGNTLYSTVQHVKGKNGKKSKAPKGAVSNPPAESCYAMVQLPVDKNNSKVPPISANRGPPKAAQKLLNKPSDPSKTSPKGANRDLPKTPVESCYAEVTVPK